MRFILVAASARRGPQDDSHTSIGIACRLGAAPPEERHMNQEPAPQECQDIARVRSSRESR
jgi:hypothetical protein